MVKTIHKLYSTVAVFKLSQLGEHNSPFGHFGNPELNISLEIIKNMLHIHLAFCLFSVDFALKVIRLSDDVTVRLQVTSISISIV